MIRLGLCCKFFKEDISFREVRFIHIKNKSKLERRAKFNEVILHNLYSLLKALDYCDENGILAFRVSSTLLPLYTHPECEYQLEDLEDFEKIFTLFRQAKLFAEKRNIRLTFHPDQFVILNSPSETVHQNAVKDLLYHNMVSDLLGADVINIHAGGVYGDKNVALKRLKKNVLELPREVREKLSFENDDKSYSPEDLIPVCEELKIPFVYDIHHHRCLQDTMSFVEASRRGFQTWNREPLFHISSPKEGWDGPKPHRHHDYIDIKDFPSIWHELGDFTLDIEAKAKELAVLKIKQELGEN